MFYGTTLIDILSLILSTLLMLWVFINRFKLVFFLSYQN